MHAKKESGCRSGWTHTHTHIYLETLSPLSPSRSLPEWDGEREGGRKRDVYGERSQRSVWKLASSGEIQCISLGNFAPRSPNKWHFKQARSLGKIGEWV